MVSLVPGLPNEPESSEWVEGLTQQHAPRVSFTSTRSAQSSKSTPGPSNPPPAVSEEPQKCCGCPPAEMQHQEDARRAATELGAKETPEAMDNAPSEITSSAAGELGAREKTPQLVFAKIANL
ncbi:hypothetical protein C8J56DRAFT_1165752 [Mycena floridula]|nr:hypothetical protein C8J56DRAFT_1165752 [Mycena floridula]